MNKTVSINLSGQVFQIDENAFEKLKRYLESIRKRFENAEGQDEIISDIETRIAEMFAAKLNDKKQVVSIHDVEEMITQMGRPEDFEGIEDDESRHTTENSNQSKRLYRNSDDKVLGGVCAGLSAYLGVNDPFWFRLIFLLAVLFSIGSSFIVYVILWLIVPEAKTVSEKLEMKGEYINISNIEKTVKEDLNDLKDRLQNLSSRGNVNRARNGIENLVDLIISIITVFFRVLFKLIAVTFIAAGIAMTIAIMLTFLVPMGIFGFSLAPLFPLLFASKLLFFTGVIGIFLLVGTPAFVFVYLGFRLIFGMKSRIKGLGITFAVLWILGWGLSTIAVARTAADYKENQTIRHEIKLDQPSNDIIVLDISRLTHIEENKVVDFFDFGEFLLQEDRVLIKDRIQLDVKRSLTGNFELHQTFEASGITKVKAYERAEAIDYGMIQEDSALYFNDYFMINTDKQFRGQQIKMVLRVPEGKSVYLTHASGEIIYDIKNVTDTYDGYMIGHTWTMLEDGLTCMDCDWLPDEGEQPISRKAMEKTFDFENFGEVEIDGSFDIEIRHDKKFSVALSGDEEFIEQLQLNQRSNRLTIETTKRLSNLWRQRHGGKVIITMPELIELEIGGASESEIIGFDQNEMTINIHGASKSILNVDVKNLKLEIKGASDVELKGKGQDLEVEILGASTLKAFDYKVDNCSIEVLGASNAEISASSNLNAEANGASNIIYRGLPTISSDVTGFSSIKPNR